MAQNIKFGDLDLKKSLDKARNTDSKSVLPWCWE